MSDTALARDAICGVCGRRLVEIVAWNGFAWWLHPPFPLGWPDPAHNPDPDGGQDTP